MCCVDRLNPQPLCDDHERQVWGIQSGLLSGVHSVHGDLSRTSLCGLSSFRGTEFIVLHAVFCALPFFLVAFTASSLATLLAEPTHSMVVVKPPILRFGIRLWHGVAS